MLTDNEEQQEKEIRIRGYCNQTILINLERAKFIPTVTKLTLIDIDFDSNTNTNTGTNSGDDDGSSLLLLHTLKDLLHCCYEDGKDEIKSTTRTRTRTRTWESIHFHRCSGPIYEALKDSPNIKEIHFFDEDALFVDEEDTSTISKFHILHTNNPNLIKVSFENIHFSTTLIRHDMICLSKGLATNTTLRSFALIKSYLDFDSCIMLAQQGLAKNKNLTEIKISDCGLSDDAIVCTIKALALNRALEKLSLQGNHCKTKGVSAIAAASLLNRLVHLDLSRQNVLYDKSEKLQIASLLCCLKDKQTATKLKSLFMSECNLDDDDLCQLSDVFIHNKVLQDVDLRWNKFSSKAIKNQFANKLNMMNGGLKRIQLQKQKQPDSATSGSEGVVTLLHEDRDLRDVLIQGLTDNRTLQSIDLFDSDEAIEYLCLLNKAGREVVLKDNKFSIKLWPQLALRTEKIIDAMMMEKKESKEANIHINTNTRRRALCLQSSSIYYFLRHGTIIRESESRQLEHL